MKRGFVIAFFFISFAMILSIPASFENGTPSFEITKQYSQDDSIKGWINISIEDEIIDSLFTDSFGNSISLIELLELNENLEYVCSPSDCENDYSSGNPENEKTFSLNKGQSRIIGIKITGDNFEMISDFSINVSSTATESIRPQLYIDILNNGEFEWKAYKQSNNFHDEDYGCYSSPDETVLIYNEPYCGKINIPIAPNVEIGAYVIEESGGDVSFDMSICDEDYINCNYCEATASTGGRISCVSDKKIEKKENFFVCINTKNSIDNNKYRINSETNNSCGFALVQENKRDFEIFAKPGKYAPIGEFTLNNDELQNIGNYIDLRFYIEDYMERYSNSCPNGCIIPINFTANALQTITISDLSVFYTSSGTLKETNEIYDLTEIPIKITSDFQKIYLDNANFFISGIFGEKINYSLDLNDNEIFSDEITIEKIPQITSLTPRTAIAAFPTEFTVNVETFDSLTNITKYEWDFGNGNTETTIENKATNTYNTLGSYILKISVTDSNSFTSSRTFNLTVKTPKEAINSVLKNKLDSLNNVNLQLGGLSLFHKESLSKTLNLTEIEIELSSLQKRNATAIFDEDYVNIMKDLVNLKVPESVFKSEIVESVNFYPNENSINLEILQSIAGGSYTSDTESGYTKSVMSWYFGNVDAKITLKGFSMVYEGSTKKVLNFFEIKINENQERRDSYFIMPQLNNLEFKENYQQREISNYIYIEIPTEGKVFEFSTTENIGFSELPAFISPSISELPVLSIDISEDKERLSRQTIFILSIILAFFIGFIVYIVIQQWYKRKYEDYLFKNKNDLYNIISYIESAKKRGLKDKEIRVKLKKVGWNSEQVTYVMKKYAGKRTGMFEIPIDKVLNLFKKKKSLTSLQKKFQAHPPQRKI